MALVFAPDGTPGEVPDSQLEAALSQGYKRRSESGKEKLMREERERGLAGDIGAGIVGFASGIPVLGPAAVKGAAALTGAIEGRPTEEVMRELAIQREVHPDIEAASQVGGTIAGVAATGGLGLAAELGVAGAALEGGIVGISNAWGDSVIENVPLTAEKVAAEGAAGAFAGGLTHGVFSMLSKGASAVVKRFGAVAAKQVVEEAAPAASGLFNPVAAVGTGLGSAALDKATGNNVDWGDAAKNAALGGFGISRGKLGQLKSAAGKAAKLLGADGVSSLARVVESKLLPIIERAPMTLGPARAALEAAAARGGEALLEEHTKLANGPNGDQYLAAVGMQRENSQEAQTLGSKISNYEAIKQSEAAFSKSLGRAEDALFGASKGRPASTTVPQVKNFKKDFENLQKVMLDPTAAYEQIPPEMRNAFPDASTQIVTTLLNGAKFLTDKAPKDPQAGLPGSVRIPWKPSRVELDRWYKYHEAVTAPQEVLKKLSRGMLAPEYLEAVQAVYPLVYEEFKMKVAQRLQMTEKPLPYKTKLALQQIVGPQATGMTPQQTAIMQMAHQPKQQGPKGGPDGRQKIDAEKNQQTQAQRLEGR